MKPVIMKLPYLIRPTLMPGFPGAEQVPAGRDCVQAEPGPGEHHVEDQDQDHCPDERRPLPRVAGNTEPLTGAQTDGGVGDGSACENVRANPSMTNPVPIVVMNEGTPRVTVMNPFTQPATTPASSPRMIAMNAGT